MFRLVTRWITLSVSTSCITSGLEVRLTETTLPPISPRRISLIKSSTPIAPGKSFLFAKTSNGTDWREGKPRRACSSDVAVGRDFVCQVSLSSHFGMMARAHIGSINHISVCQLIYYLSMGVDIQYSIRSSTISIPHSSKFRLTLYISSFLISSTVEDIATSIGDKEMTYSYIPYFHRHIPFPHLPQIECYSRNNIFRPLIRS
jgi:hypothetical protein